jgi:hypothetical protein
MGPIKKNKIKIIFIEEYSTSRPLRKWGGMRQSMVVFVKVHYKSSVMNIMELIPISKKKGN